MEELRLQHLALHSLNGLELRNVLCPQYLKERPLHPRRLIWKFPNLIGALFYNRFYIEVFRIVRNTPTNGNTIYKNFKLAINFLLKKKKAIFWKVPAELTLSLNDRAPMRETSSPSIVIHYTKQKHPRIFRT